VIWEASLVALRRHPTVEAAHATLVGVFGEDNLCVTGGIDVGMLETMRNGWPCGALDPVTFDPSLA
jgi:hypothetical protein